MRATETISYLATGGWNQQTVINESGGAFEIIGNLFAILGFGIIIFTLFKAVIGFAKGADGKLFRTIAMGVIAAILCFSIEAIPSWVDSAGNLVNKGMCTIQSALDSDAVCAADSGGNSGTGGDTGGDGDGTGDGG